MKHAAVGLLLMLTLTGCATLKGVWAFVTSADRQDQMHHEDGTRKEGEGR